MPLTQEELSNLAGMSRAKVNRVLREAQGRGESSCGEAGSPCSTAPGSRHA